MSQHAVEYCLGRMMTDDQFRSLAMESFPLACRRLGLDLTAMELDLLSQLDFSSLAEIACSLDRGLLRTGTNFEQ
ncbi:MAG: Os1348 family NHLP clan protein [Desulfobulbus sp.]|nr:Os1348 family NHLP clan protein [Desulfobulbus sp.]